MDGPHAGRWSLTNPSGIYFMDDFQPGTVTLKASADGFQSVTRTVTVGPDTVDFKLAPVFAMMRFSWTGDLAPADGTCSNGTAQRPCRIVTFPVHNAGPVKASLQWNPTDVDLDMHLFETATQSRVASSALAGVSGIGLRAEVSGGANYELHITYAAGTSDVTFSLTLENPN